MKYPKETSIVSANRLLLLIRENFLKNIHDQRLTKSQSLFILSGFQRHTGP